MKKLKLMTIVGTRPEIIKMSEIIKLADKIFDHVLVHTGQNYDYELNQIFFEELGIRKPDHYLGVVGNDLGETMGNVLSKSYKLMKEVKPDALIVLGDTNSCLCVISAKRLKIPIFHMEAGNRCFDENLPEEVNRRIVDTTSDVNLCYTEHARRNLIEMGFPSGRIFVIGSPMKEVLGAHRDKIERSTALRSLGLKKDSYIVVSAHREENIDNDSNLNVIIDALNSIAREYAIPIIYSMHPRSKKRFDESKVAFDSLIKPIKPLGFCDYIHLQQNSFCVISDSGTLAEESAILEFPAISLRTSTERPEAIDCGGMILGSIEKNSLIASVNTLRSMRSFGYSISCNDYQNEHVSTAVIKLIQGYTRYIDKNVWDK